MDLPLESIHKNAFKAAEAARCAGDQGKYWEMHDRLFANQQKLDEWKTYAEAVGLDVARFQECIDSDKPAEAIRADMAQARAAGTTGTPAFFLAYTDSKSSKVTTVLRLSGALPFTAFKAAIDKLLAQSAEAPKEKGLER